MSELRCIVKDKDGKQCSTVIEVSEPVVEKVNYICRHHSDSVQRAAAGNAKVPRSDTHIQEYQFDHNLRHGRAPIGSEHIQNQGSNILTPGKIHAVDRPDRDRE